MNVNLHDNAVPHLFYLNKRSGRARNGMTVDARLAMFVAELLLV